MAAPPCRTIAGPEFGAWRGGRARAIRRFDIADCNNAMLMSPGPAEKNGDAREEDGRRRNFVTKPREEERA